MQAAPYLEISERKINFVFHLKWANRVIILRLDIKLVHEWNWAINTKNKYLKYLSSARVNLKLFLKHFHKQEAMDVNE